MFRPFRRHKWILSSLKSGSGSSGGVQVEVRELPFLVAEDNPSKKRILRNDFNAKLIAYLDKTAFSGKIDEIQTRFDAENPVKIAFSIEGHPIELSIRTSSLKNVERIQFLGDVVDALIEIYRQNSIKP